MRNIPSIYSLPALLLVIVVGCTPGVHRSSVDKDRRTGAEDRFDPLGFPGDDAVITGKYRDAGQAQRSESTETALEQIDLYYNESDDDYTPEQDQAIVIFRVQVFASKSFDEAQQFAGDIEGMFPEGVFVEYQIPYYKVRVGEFFTPEEGEAFLDGVKRMGFRNAWLVRVVQ